MKHAFCLLLALLLCLSLCTCSDNETEPMLPSSNSTPTQPTKQDNTVPTVTVPTEPAQPTTPPGYTEIPITLDNWDQYFEFERLTFLKETESGEIDTWYCLWVLHLKEEYEESFAYSSNNLAVHFTCKHSTYRVIRHEDTRTFELAERIGDTREIENIFKLGEAELVDPATGKTAFYYPCGVQVSAIYLVTVKDQIGYCENFAVVDICGSIFLANK